MIDLYYWPTPNGWKISIALEELGLEYNVKPVNIGRGEQFAPDFLAISPNNKIPAIVDHQPTGGDGPLAVFESGAILLYLAEKTARLLPADVSGRFEVLEWLFWQVGGLGPMLGQNHHFRIYSPQKIPYAIDRYTDETHRLYAVLDSRLESREYICGAYSIADIASWPWIVPHERQGMSLAEFPNLERWFAAVAERPAVQRGLVVGEQLRQTSPLDEEARKHLFGQRGR
ncbi:MAG: glutathione S-transferase N-terminal domain-containing protein [Acidobacteria bacterium]|jgi:GST-like protein|nr:glutathione S-transferase N-terminal domain-containing protein [Acidobacteriota bacterium]